MCRVMGAVVNLSLQRLSQNVNVGTDGYGSCHVFLHITKVRPFFRPSKFFGNYFYHFVRKIWIDFVFEAVADWIFGGLKGVCFQNDTI